MTREPTTRRAWVKFQDGAASKSETTRPPNRGRPKRTCRSQSANRRGPFLGLCLGPCNGLRRKLEHCRFLTFEQGSQQNDLTVWKFQRIVMGVRVVPVDLPEDGRRVLD